MILRSQGSWSLYYDRWAAMELDTKLFWGPNHATEFVSQCRPVDPTDGWLDDVWCEGAALIDHDQRHLLWFGGDDVLYDVDLRAALLSLMRMIWHDWTVDWAGGGICEVGETLGVDSERFTSARTFSEMPFVPNLEPDEERDVLLTVESGGRTLLGYSGGDIESLVRGPAVAELIIQEARHDELRWYDAPPICGVHLVPDKRQLYYWYAMPGTPIASQVTAAWPGWETTWVADDGLEWHLNVARGLTWDRATLRELQFKWLDQLRRTHHHLASDRARDLARIISGTAGSATRLARGSVGDSPSKRRLLDDLLRRLGGSGSDVS